jgi:hypothetical protein
VSGALVLVVVGMLVAAIAAVGSLDDVGRVLLGGR